MSLATLPKKSVRDKRMNHAVKMKKKKNNKLHTNNLVHLLVIHNQDFFFPSGYCIVPSCPLLSPIVPRSRPHTISPPLFSSVPLFSSLSQVSSGLGLETSNSPYFIFWNNF